MLRSFIAATLSAALSVTPAAAGPATPTGTFTDLGAPVSSLTITEGVLGHDGGGNDVIYAVPAGDDARLNVINPLTNQLEAAVPLPGASGAWGITVASDGRLYVGSYGNGHLYRYAPATGAVTDLGQPVPGEQYIYGLSAGPDGTVYGGTYPHTHAFAYHPDGTVTDYGALDDVEQYARATAFDPDNGALYVGIANPTARIIRIDTATGAHQDVTPAGFTGTSVFDLNYADGVVFAEVDSTVRALDAGTGALLSMTVASTGASVTSYPIAARGVSPEHAGSVYFTTTGAALTRFDIATRTITPVTNAAGTPVVVTRGAAIAYGWVTVAGQPHLYGLAGNYSGGTFDFDPGTLALRQWSSPFQYVPSQLMNTIAGADGKVYLSVYLNGQTAVYDPATGSTTQPVRLGQVEDWTWHDGKLEAGIYPYGQVSEWDPTAASGTTNPKPLFALLDQYDQDRPVAVVADGNHLWAGTTPGYGRYGGALTAYDFGTGTFTVDSGIIPDQSIASLVQWHGVLFGGSSIDGGQGTQPVAKQAVLFRWDPVHRKVRSTSVPVPGAESLSALTVGPGGALWGLADGTVFVADPVTGRVLRRVAVFHQGTGVQDGALVWSPDHRWLYGVAGGRLFAVNRLTMRATVLVASGVLRLTAAPDGSLYTLLRPAGGLAQTHLARFVPTQGG